PSPKAPTAAPKVAPKTAVQPATYVGAKACTGCHGEIDASWRTSDHAHAMAKLTPETASGDFSGAVGFESDGLKVRLRREGDAFIASVQTGDAPAQDHTLAYTFGREPLQQYLVEAPGGRYQVLPVAWDVEKKRWYDPQPESESFHWQGVYANWNVMCATCHSTNLDKNYDLDANRYNTTWSEINVACEACHGPASHHIDWAGGERSIPDKGLLWTATPQKEHELDVCGPCHARRQSITDTAGIGEPFLNHYAPELLREGLYFADGQILDEVFVLGSFMQSKMHRNAVVCSDCHDVHSGRLRASEADVCARCHAPAQFAVTAHHLHPEGSEGARCVTCHMPERTYMGIDARRDHSLRVPRPDLSISLGTPNACNGCHTDQSPTWAAEQIAQVHGQPPDHYGVAIAAGRAGRPEGLEALIALAGNADASAIVRATAVELLGAYPPRKVRKTLVQALGAKEPLLRFAAIPGVAPWPPKARLAALRPLLRDPLRLVRIQAARGLVDLMPAMNEADTKAVKTALEEYRVAQRANADHPGGRLNLATVAAAVGDAKGAEGHYRAALDLDPSYVPAAINLAGLLEGVGKRPEALALLTDLASQQPESAELCFALGLVMAADGRFEEAAMHLKRATQLRPHDPRFSRNYRGVLGKLSPEAKARVEGR
ncbi:MAG: tetratricopeptide repeat protein, partial [Myxococcota bacterium]